MNKIQHMARFATFKNHIYDILILCDNYIVKFNDRSDADAPSPVHINSVIKASY